jgi:hypothetical protein
MSGEIVFEKQIPIDAMAPDSSQPLNFVLPKLSTTPVYIIDLKVIIVVGRGLEFVFNSHKS